jgi:hypothetical protein
MITPRILKACLVGVAFGLGACTSSAPYQQAAAPVATTADGVVLAGPNVVVPGAQRPIDSGAYAQAYTSDNQPSYTRSGLNSDPTNPSGAPGPATITGSSGYSL